jgi:hypothetical protein
MKQYSTPPSSGKYIVLSEAEREAILALKGKPLFIFRSLPRQVLCPLPIPKEIEAIKLLRK